MRAPWGQLQWTIENDDIGVGCGDIDGALTFTRNHDVYAVRSERAGTFECLVSDLAHVIGRLHEARLDGRASAICVTYEHDSARACEDARARNRKGRTARPTERRATDTQHRNARAEGPLDACKLAPRARQKRQRTRARGPTLESSLNRKANHFARIMYSRSP